MPPLGWHRGQQCENSKSSRTANDTVILSRPDISKSRVQTISAPVETPQEQLAITNPDIGQNVAPSRTNVSYINDARLQEMEEVMLQTFESNKATGSFIEPFTDDQIDQWNLAWGTNLQTNILKSAMDKFQDVKASLAAPEPWSVINEGNDPITKLICLYRNSMVAGRHIEVFNTMLEEVLELYEQFGIDNSNRLNQDPLKVDNDAILADYVVAVKLLTSQKMHKPEWKVLVGYQLAEIGMRESNGTWSGPTNNARQWLAPSQSMEADLKECEEVFVAELGHSEENLAIPAVDVLEDASIREEVPNHPAKRGREDEDVGGDMVENGSEEVNDLGTDIARTTRPVKRLRRNSDYPSPEAIQEAFTVPQQLSISPDETYNDTCSQSYQRPSTPADHFSHPSRHPRAKIAEALAETKRLNDSRPADSQLETAHFNGNLEEDHESRPDAQDSASLREISPFFDGEDDVDF